MHRLRIFAGPNGSGKSTLYQNLQGQFNLGHYLNPDELHQQVSGSKKLKLDALGIEAKQSEWNFFWNGHGLADKAPLLQKSRIENNILDRATNMTYTAANGTLIRSFEYDYDAASMISKKRIFNNESGTPNSEVNYTYDSLDRLRKEVRTAGGSPATVVYNYDLAGNRTSIIETGTTNTYALGTGNRLAFWGTNGSALYDTAGNTTNLVSNDGTELDLNWDERYRLTSVSNSVFDIQYVYDVQGRKISRTAGGSPATVERYIYDGQQIVADLDDSNNLLRTYTWGAGIDNLLSFTDHTTTNTYYAIKDHQNTVIALTDSTGTIVESYEYDAYGRTKVFSATGAQLTTSAIGSRYTFQGREIDWDTGLTYFRARWYNPETGRWLSKDPIGISGGLNLYVFCGNNPVMFIDPYGQSWATVFAVVAAVAVVVGSVAGGIAIGAVAAGTIAVASNIAIGAYIVGITAGFISAGISVVDAKGKIDDIDDQKQGDKDDLDDIDDMMNGGKTSNDC